MHIKHLHVQSFKRFSDLTITDLPPSARLVVMVGPNGCGKSSLFEAFSIWHFINAFRNYNDQDTLYYPKWGVPPTPWPEMVRITFHEPTPSDLQALKRVFYFRSAYRNEADFTLSTLQRQGSDFDRHRVRRLIDNDASVSINYQGLVAATVKGLYGGEFDDIQGIEIKDLLIGQIRHSMRRVFGDLLLEGPGDPLQDGTFFFDKGVSKGFHYKNLSGGEKAAFDLLLDMTVKRHRYSDTVFCIDEPETHINTRLQARLLTELVELVPEDCQLWISTHFIGMMRQAKELQAAKTGDVVFLDFFDKDFDQPVTLQPAPVNRQFWTNILDVTLDDLAGLIAPRQLVLCEGRPVAQGDTDKAEFDARCYRAIFGDQFPDTDFISVGNEFDVRTDQVKLGKAIQTLISGTTVIRLVDRDDRSRQEIADLQKEGVRILSKRHLEAYLMDDEILLRLCKMYEQPELGPSVLAAKKQAIQASIDRGNPPDDVKSASGAIYAETKRILRLTQVGSTARTFMRDTLAPLITHETTVYAQLKYDIFC